jgi:hypothetical protein
VAAENIWCEGHVLYFDMMMLADICIVVGSPRSKVLVVTKSELEAAVFNLTHISHIWLFSHRN